MCRAALVSFILSAVLLRSSIQQFATPINECPDYFAYERYGNEIIGKITLPNVETESITLDATLSQKDATLTPYSGRLSLYEDQQTTIRNIQSGAPVLYRIDFPTPGVAPKITEITVNGRVLCSSRPYTPPSVTLRLQHKLATVDARKSVGTQFLSSPSIQPAPLPVPTRFQTNQQQQTPIPTRFQTNQQQQTPIQGVDPQGDLSSQCGQEGSGLVPFIHGGSIIERGQYPWLAPIYQKLAAGLKFLCGGSLISSRTIITAAHCFTITSLRANQIVVYVGRYKLDSFIEDGIQTRELQNLLIHPEYNPNVYPDADIALLVMGRPVSFTSLIRPICLWGQNADSVEGQTGVVAGWGSDENGNDVSPVPKMVEANIVSEVACIRTDGYSGLTSPRTICAGNRDGTGPCKGDSGGGLMINRNGRWVLRGVVSAGQTKNRQCNLNEYVIYCDLAKHHSWIASNMLQ